MENNYLLDTNIVIYYFDGVFSKENRGIDSIFENSFNISIITKIEFLGWVGFKELRLYTKAKEFIDKAVTVYIDDSIAEEAIRLRREHKIKIPDAIIAATALTTGLTLATTNVDDFKKLNLDTYNPLI